MFALLASISYLALTDISLTGATLAAAEADDRYWDRVVAICDFTGANGSAVVDTSKFAGAVTHNGGVAISGAKAVFDGVDDFFSLADLRRFTPDGPSRKLTVECHSVIWNAINNGDDAQVLASHYKQLASNRSWELAYREAEHELAFIVSSDGSTNTDVFASFTPIIGRPYQIWGVADGAKIWLYIDGVPVASTAFSGTFNNTSQTLKVGADQNSAGATARLFNGSMRGCRVTVGAARYTGELVTPAELPFPTTRRAGVTNANYYAVLLQAQFTGSNGSTTFTDESQYGQSLTAVANAQIQSNKLELDGNDDGVTSPNRSDYTLRNTDFTLEAFGVELDNTTNPRPILALYDAFAPASNSRTWLLSYQSGSLLWVVSSAGTSGTTLITYTFTPGTGAHDYAVERNGNNWYLYVDGVQHGTTSNSIQPFDNATSLLAIGLQNASGGSANSEQLDGRLKAVRISEKGLYGGSNYTPDSLPLATN